MTRVSMRRRQRGVALITAVLIVALGTMLAASVFFRGYLDQRRSATLFALDQAYEVALGAEAWAADFLRQDRQDSETDHFGEAWAKPLPPLPLDDEGTVEGRLEDMQGRFNLNNLKTPEGLTNEAAVEQLERILEMLEIEPSWAAAIADWIDVDGEPGFPDGAEDSVYTSLTPPHRAANMAITRASELMVLDGFGAERYAKLAPHVTALPVGEPLNVCTASGVVLDSLKENVREFSLSAEDLAKRRTERCFPDKNDLQGWIGDPAEWNQIQDSLTESSNWFRANVWVTIGTTQFTLYSLLARADQGPVRTILRSFGSE
jgi:general secretion pathway protein K